MVCNGMVDPFSGGRLKIDSSSPIPVYLQIEQLIEQLILTQQLSAHELIPSVAVLARQLKVAPLTVQRAYRRLQERRLIYSIAGKGSFVADTADQQFVGVLVHHQVMLDAPQAPTMALLIRAICEELAELRLPVRIFTDTCPYSHKPTISPDVVSSLKKGRPIGMILVAHHGSEELYELARERSFPVIGINTGAQADVRFTFDLERMLRASLASLRERKIEEAALIWLDQNNSPAERLDYLRQVERHMIDCGMTPKQEWIIGVNQGTDWAGYHAFNHLWSLPRRPHGLVVMDDVIGRGVHMAVLARQIRVPDDLAVVVQTNEDSPITFPEQWQQAGYNLTQCGQRAVEVLQTLLAGGKVESDIKLPFAWHSASHRSPWEAPANRCGAAGGHDGTLFRSGREILETIA